MSSCRADLNFYFFGPSSSLYYTFTCIIIIIIIVFTNTYWVIICCSTVETINLSLLPRNKLLLAVHTIYHILLKQHSLYISVVWSILRVFTLTAIFWQVSLNINILLKNKTALILVILFFEITLVDTPWSMIVLHSKLLLPCWDI